MPNIAKTHQWFWALFIICIVPKFELNKNGIVYIEKFTRYKNNMKIYLEKDIYNVDDSDIT